jgi:hypothetical protein
VKSGASRTPLTRAVESLIAHPSAVQPASAPVQPAAPAQAQTPPPPQPMTVPKPEEQAELDTAAEECTHMFKHLGEIKQLLQARSEGGSEQKAISSYLDELEALDPTHPKLHLALKLHVAKVSSRATRIKELSLDPLTTETEASNAVDNLTAAIEALGEYCAPLSLVQGDGEAS